MIDARKYMEWLSNNYPDSGKRKKYFYMIETPLGLKIGITNNLAKRWSSAYKQTASKFTHVFGPYPHCENMESDLKSLYKNRCISGSSETFPLEMKDGLYWAVIHYIDEFEMNKWK